MRLHANTLLAYTCKRAHIPLRGHLQDRAHTLQLPLSLLATALTWRRASFESSGADGRREKRVRRRDASSRHWRGVWRARRASNRHRGIRVYVLRGQSLQQGRRYCRQAASGAAVSSPHPDTPTIHPPAACASLFARAQCCCSYSHAMAARIRGAESGECCRSINGNHCYA